MAEHTPGPWKRVGNVVRKHGGGTVAICPNVYKGGVMEFSANARLIAAAPELLDAAKCAARAIFEMEDMDHVERMEWFESSGLDLYDQLRAAIAKAQGTDR